MNKQVFPVYQYLSPIRHWYVLSVQKTEDCGETEWWDETHTDMNDGFFFSVLITDNVPFNLWNLSFLTDRDGVEGSPPVLLILWASIAPRPLGTEFHRGSTGEKGGKHWGPICFSLSPIIKVMPSAKERWSFMSKRFFFEPLWRWLKHFLKRWRQMSSQSPQIQFHWKRSPICLVMDCSLVPTNGTSWLISLGCSPWRNTTQTNKHHFLWFLLKYFHF